MQKKYLLNNKLIIRKNDYTIFSPSQFVIYRFDKLSFDCLMLWKTEKTKTQWIKEQNQKANDDSDENFTYFFEKCKKNDLIVSSCSNNNRDG